MPGGKGNIRPSDNPKPFKKGNKAAEKWTEELALKFGNSLIIWMNKEDENVFFEEFIYMNKHEEFPKITTDTPSYLASKYSTFSDLLTIAKKIEEFTLKKFSAFNKLNPQICKFLLSAQYGYTEKTSTDNTLKADVKVGIINIDPLSDESDNGTD